MNTEMKQLIEDAAKLLGIDKQFSNKFNWLARSGFNPLDPERGDLMKVAEAAELFLNFKTYQVVDFDSDVAWFFDRDDYQSLALAVLRAASAVLKSRGE